MKIELSRAFEHRTVGRIGSVTLTVTDQGEWFLNGTKLPEASARYLAEYSLQCLQDAYAGIGTSKTEAEGRAAFDKRLDALIAGTVGMRAATGEPAINRFIREVIRKNLSGENKKKYDALKDADEKREALWALYERAPEDVRAKIDALAERLLAEDAKRKAEEKKLFEGFEL